LVALCFVAVLCPGLFVGRFVAVVIVEHPSSLLTTNLRNYRLLISPST